MENVLTYQGKKFEKENRPRKQEKDDILKDINFKMLQVYYRI